MAIEGTTPIRGAGDLRAGARPRGYREGGWRP